MHFDTVNSVVLENVPTPQSRGHGVEGGGVHGKGCKAEGVLHNSRREEEDGCKVEGAKLPRNNYVNRK